MMHLIWMKNETVDESRTIKEMVLQAYKEMFFSPDLSLPIKRQAKEIVNHLLK
jgi:hypothetical protein